jgi:predicted regulator of Ras-like GTPase activity (Roadblock/LC7/MglB family)
MPTNTPLNTFRMPGPWHGIACHCEPGTHASHCPTKTAEPIAALASAANAAANALRDQINNGDNEAVSIRLAVVELLRATEALTTAICDAAAQ